MKILENIYNIWKSEQKFYKILEKNQIKVVVYFI